MEIDERMQDGGVSACYGHRMPRETRRATHLSFASPRAVEPEQRVGAVAVKTCQSQLAKVEDGKGRAMH
jgi:hypothetical protein